MNKRQWKKACLKAAQKLNGAYPGECEFYAATGGELIAAPKAYLMEYHGPVFMECYVEAPRGILLARPRTGCPEELGCITALEFLESAEAQQARSLGPPSLRLPLSRAAQALI